MTGGAALSLTPRVALAGDYGVLLDRSEDERPAWSAGLQVGVPYTPHSFSIHATNVGTASLEGTSRGLRTRWGFEYTIPITVRRYVPSGGDGDDSEDMAGAAAGGMEAAAAMDMTDSAAASGAMGESMGESMAAADTVFVDIKNLAYGKERIEITPGTTVVWRNMDPIQHSVTNPDSIFDSGLIDPGKSFTWTFADQGTFPFHCVPHPFMKGTVVVSGMRESSSPSEGGAP